MNDYLENLDRALKHLPEIKSSGERFVIPEPKLLTEGKTTVLENFAAIVDKLNQGAFAYFQIPIAGTWNSRQDRWFKGDIPEKINFRYGFRTYQCICKGICNLLRMRAS